MVSLPTTFANKCKIVYICLNTSAKIRFKLLLPRLFLLKQTYGVFSDLFCNTHANADFCFGS